MYNAITPGYSKPTYTVSDLEHMVSCYSIEHKNNIPNQLYVGTHSKETPYSTYLSVHTQPVVFLRDARPHTPLIASALEVLDPVGQAFFFTTGQDLPADINITVASRDELIKMNLAFLNNSVVGLSLHKSREIFVVAGPLAEVILTIGHELGHIIIGPAKNVHDEEAKAFAFEAAFAKTIFENDISGLASSINAASFNPAKNGVHDVAFNFVRNHSMESDSPFNLFNKLAIGEISTNQIFGAQSLNPTPLKSIPAYKNHKRPPIYGGYLNKSRVQNLAPPHNFFWSDLGKGIYGMYVPLTKIESINEQLLRKDIEQLHKTLGHEYSLHHVMGLPDGYVVEALEEAMFWTADEPDKYSPKNDKSSII